MKKLLLLVALTVLSYCAKAQITVSQVDLPTANSKWGEVVDLSAGAHTITPAGPNQIWNYAFNAVDTQYIKLHAASSSPYASDFPSSTYYQHLPTDSLYLFMYNDPAGQNLDGVHIYKANQPFSTLDLIPDGMGFPTPFTYNDSTGRISRSVNFFTYSGFPAKYGTMQKTSYKADAWGTINIPSGTYNVIRVKAITYQYDTMYVKIGPTYSAIQNNVDTLTYYHFVTNSSDFIVASIKSNNTFDVSIEANMRVNNLTEPVFVSFSNTNNNGCAPHQVDFTNSSTLGYHYVWDFGDGDSSTSYHASHTYTQAGNYNVMLSVYDTSDGFWNSKGSTNTSIYVSQEELYYNSDSLCVGESFHIYTPNGNNYTWDMGDGTIYYNPNVNHNYNNPGNYLVSVDFYSNMCGNITLTKNVYVGDDALPNADFWYQSPACAGDSVVFSAQNYNATQYTWDFSDGTTIIKYNSGNTQVVKAFAAAGSYTATLTVTNDCGQTNSHSETITIQNSASSFEAYAFASTFSNSTCPGATVNFYTHTPASSYTWNFGDGSSAYEMSPSHAYSTTGIYNVELIMVNGCGADTTVYTDVDVNSNSPYSGSIWSEINPTNVCPNETADFNANSDVAVSYFWDFGDGSTSNEKYINHSFVSTGLYNVSLTLTNSCGADTTIQMQIAVTDTAKPDLSNGLMIPSTSGCPGDTLFFISENYSSITWDFGDGSIENNPSIFDAGNGEIVRVARHAFSSIGTYWVKVSVTNECGNSATDSIEITIGSFAFVSGDFGSMGDEPFAACSDVQFFGFGGSNYVYDYGDGSSDTSSNGFTIHKYTQPGTYNLVGTISNSCGNDTTIYKTVQIDGMSVSGTSTDALCFNSADGSIALTVNGGTAPYTYSWSDASTNNTLTNAAGNYDVTVTDANGCSVSESYSISAPTAIAISKGATPAACGNSNGAAHTNITGGTAPYTYVWDNYPTELSGNLSNIAAGFYTVTVSDANACSKTATITVPNVSGPNMSIDNTVSETCEGMNNGLIAVSSTGAAPFTYTWNTIPESNDSVVTGLAAGTYQVQIKDANNCIFSYSFNIGIANNAPTVNLSAPNGTSVCGSGSIVLDATGASNIFWSTAESTSSINVNVVVDTTVSVWGNNIAGCNSDTVEINLVVNEVPSIIIQSVVNANCGQQNGSACVSVSGGLLPYIYSWAGLISETSACINNVSSGGYNLTVTDNNGCIQSHIVSINNIDGPTVSIANYTNISCNQGVDGTATASFTGGTTPFTYLWTPSGQTTLDASSLAAGDYVFEVTDSAGCIGTVSITLTEPSAIALNFVSLPDNVCDSAQAINLEANPAGGTFTGTYVSGTMFDAPNSTGGSYSLITYDYTDGNGCSNSITDSVFVDLCLGLNEYADASDISMYPNPVKDILQIDMQGKEINSVEIYNTQGQLLLRKKASVIDVKEIPAGVYSITVITKEERVTKRFVKE